MTNSPISRERNPQRKCGQSRNTPLRTVKLLPITWRPESCPTRPRQRLQVSIGIWIDPVFASPRRVALTMPLLWIQRKIQGRSFTGHHQVKGVVSGHQDHMKTAHEPSKGRFAWTFLKAYTYSCVRPTFDQILKTADQILKTVNQILISILQYFPKCIALLPETITSRVFISNLNIMRFGFGFGLNTVISSGWIKTANYNKWHMTAQSGCNAIRNIDVTDRLRAYLCCLANIARGDVIVHRTLRP